MEMYENVIFNDMRKGDGMNKAEKKGEKTLKGRRKEKHGNNEREVN